MSVDEGRRLLLHDAARDAWGADAALVLMEMLPPTGWGDVATRQQLEAHEVATRQQLEAVEERLDTKIDAVAERLDAKINAVAERLDTKIDAVAERLDAKIDALGTRLDARIDTVGAHLDLRITSEVGALRSDVGRMIAEGQRRALQWNVGTLIAVAGVVTAIVRIG